MAPGIDPGAALAYQPRHLRAGSSVVEHVTFNHVVAGSTPARLTKVISLKSLKAHSRSCGTIGEHATVYATV